MRILELADEDFFRSALPDVQVDFYYTGGSRQRHVQNRLHPQHIPLLRHRLAAGYYNLVACPIIQMPAWRKNRDPLRNTANLAVRLLKSFYSLGPTLYPALLHHPGVPLLVLNRKDAPVMPPQNFALLRCCTRFFVRELPQNNWNLFLFTSPRNEDVVNIVRQPLFRDNIYKIKPVSLGFAEPCDSILPHSKNKTTDIFYSGRNYSSTVRSKGMAQLEKLRALGYRVDIPDGILDRETFLRRCAAAWLTWSPEGLGWDCYRHYESLLVGSVPLINSPTIERYKPLEHGRHCFFYHIEEDGLVAAAQAALQDKERLRTVSNEGREHILRWHSHQALARYMVEETLTTFKATHNP